MNKEAIYWDNDKVHVNKIEKDELKVLRLKNLVKEVKVNYVDNHNNSYKILSDKYSNLFIRRKKEERLMSQTCKSITELNIKETIQESLPLKEINEKMTDMKIEEKKPRKKRVKKEEIDEKMTDMKIEEKKPRKKRVKKEEINEKMANMEIAEKKPRKKRVKKE